MGAIDPLASYDREKQEIAMAEKRALPGRLLSWYLFFTATGFAIFFVIPALLAAPAMLFASAHNAAGFLLGWALSVLLLSAMASWLALALLSGGFVRALPFTKENTLWFLPESMR